MNFPTWLVGAWQIGLCYPNVQSFFGVCQTFTKPKGKMSDRHAAPPAPVRCGTWDGTLLGGAVVIDRFDNNTFHKNALFFVSVLFFFFFDFFFFRLVTV